MNNSVYGAVGGDVRNNKSLGSGVGGDVGDDEWLVLEVMLETMNNSG